MLSPQDLAYFETFGFLIRRQLLTPKEMQRIDREVNDALENQVEGRTVTEHRNWLQTFVEKNPLLTQILFEDRIYRTIEGLLGPDFVWGGSEVSQNTKPEEIFWHPDRTEDQDYTRMKVMFYLEPVDRSTGCLWVIPASHRLPFSNRLRDADHAPTPFGLPAAELPGHALESRPGDAVFFNQSLWHASFGGQVGRRYMAIKFAQAPKSNEQKRIWNEYLSRATIPDDFCIQQRAD